MKHNFESFLSGMIEEFHTLRTCFPKTIVFCRKLLDSPKIYLQIRHSLQESFTEPPSSPDIHGFHMVSMYHSTVTDHTKSKIVSTFCSHKSKIRILITTNAFGLGTDCPDINRIVHWAPPTDLESYVQETG